ncbi:hypothetical protein R1flu_002274 [Riccia fluitans]|uniref:Replitron HUH endonuclease domain-containing protein n=1 Tax=Riccia fluitans TaxID=41844 RepID=A0ABD1Y9H3_9MARC
MKSIKQLARETMKRKCQQEKEQQERQTQEAKQEVKKTNKTINEDAQKPAKKPRRVPDKMFDVSLTIGIPGENVDEKVFELLVKWLEHRAEMAVLALKRGDTFLHLHVQGMLRIKTSSTRILKREIKEVIGLELNSPVSASVCLKSLHYKGLHTIIGLIGYCLKDEGTPHFKFYSKNVIKYHKAEGRRMHSIYRALEYKHKLELTPANILGRALQFCKYRVKNPLSIMFRQCIAEMIRSDQYIPGFRWLTTAKISKLRAERIWRACTSPKFVEVPNVEAIFFGVESAARYFKKQEENTTRANEDDFETEEQKTSAQRASDADKDEDADHDQQASRSVSLDEGMKQENPIDWDHLPEYFRLWN